MKEYIKLTDSQKIEAVALYQERKSFVFIAKKFGVTPSSIRYILKRRGIKSRGCTRLLTNDKFFEEIKTEESAYFLGFLYADGYIDEKRYQVELSLSAKDREILETLNKFVNLEKQLTFKKGKKHWKTGNLESDSFRLYIKNKKIAKDLIRLGLRQCKSDNLQFPSIDQIPEIFIRHFLRGYFDGDGSISKNQRCCYLISSKSFCEKAKEILNRYGIESKVAKNSNTDKIMNLRFLSNFYMKFLDFIYKDSTIYLERKYKHFLQKKIEDVLST